MNFPIIVSILAAFSVLALHGAFSFRIGSHSRESSLCGSSHATPSLPPRRTRGTIPLRSQLTASRCCCCCSYFSPACYAACLGPLSSDSTPASRRTTHLEAAHDLHASMHPPALRSDVALPVVGHYCAHVHATTRLSCTCRLNLRFFSCTLFFRPVPSPDELEGGSHSFNHLGEKSSSRHSSTHDLSPTISPPC
jgi:hypothetical protein